MTWWMVGGAVLLALVATGMVAVAQQDAWMPREMPMPMHDASSMPHDPARCHDANATAMPSMMDHGMGMMR